MKILILGGGLAGLSCSYHIGHENCIIIEKNKYLGGHATTFFRDGAFWDEGPHVSFTKLSYAKEIITTSCNSDILEYQTNVGNYFNGYWIPHPAQSNLFAVPQPLAKECYEDFLNYQNHKTSDDQPQNYQEWLDYAFGLKFSRTFPHAYTRKYWTCEPQNLSVDWVGKRVFKPDLASIKNGYNGKPRQGTHYINSVRYPSKGGFISFFDRIKNNANTIHETITSINLAEKQIIASSGRCFNYDKLISTLPLDQFIALADNVPARVLEASRILRCTSLLLVNILGVQDEQNPYHWLYVYDESKYSTRITQTHLLADSNTPDGIAGIQVEVYASAYRPFPDTFDNISKTVVKEVQLMKLLDEVHSYHYQYVPYANIIFDRDRRDAQDIVLSYLENFGLTREDDDLEPTTNWSKCHHFEKLSCLSLAGRFGQWKYFWSDDCILRGKQLGQASDK